MILRQDRHGLAIRHECNRLLLWIEIGVRFALHGDGLYRFALGVPQMENDFPGRAFAR